MVQTAEHAAEDVAAAWRYGCGAAPTVEVLVAARLAQGASAALISPAVLGIIGALFSGADRTRAIGHYATAMGLAAAGSQLIGGLLLRMDVGGLGWRTVFLVNVPVGVLALALAPRLIPETKADDAGAPDVPSLLLATAGLSALVLPLLEGRRLELPWWTWVSLAVSPLLMAAFAVRQQRLVRRGGAPLVHPQVLAGRRIRAGLLSHALLWCGQASYFLFLALYLQQGRGLSALQASSVFTVLALAYLWTSVMAPSLMVRYGARVATAGAVLLALGHLALLAGVGGNVAQLLPGLVVTGRGWVWSSLP